MPFSAHISNKVNSGHFLTMFAFLQEQKFLLSTPYNIAKGNIDISIHYVLLDTEQGRIYHRGIKLSLNEFLKDIRRITYK